MKLLTVNFLTCAVKACKTSPLSFPLHFKDAVLARTELDYNPAFLENVLPRINWEALTTTATELGLTALLPAWDEDVEMMFLGVETVKRAGEEEEGEEEQGSTAMDEGEKEKENGEEMAKKKKKDDILKKLHTFLLETVVMEGKLCCANCGFEYPIKEGVGNFLLPAHLV